MAEKKIAPLPDCASCEHEAMKKVCMDADGLSSKGCPTLANSDVLAEADKEYDRSEILEFARQASRQEADCYANRHQRPYVMQPTKTRIVEICEFAEKMKYRRLGLAFCVGLSKEAGIVEEILKYRGFEVVSVLCKAGRTLKDRIGIKDEEKIRQGTDEAMCNPIFQAKLMNHEKTELNILLGLCVGHDSIFFKYADAPTTVLAVKDRVTGHNPLAAIYLSDSYYRKIKQA
ncbi:MAG: DUF1847 domain-containing protein [Desulfobacterales bacterium]|jgi:uncharacterized metal-binding protein